MGMIIAGTPGAVVLVGCLKFDAEGESEFHEREVKHNANATRFEAPERPMRVWPYGAAALAVLISAGAAVGCRIGFLIPRDQGPKNLSGGAATS